MKASKKKSSKKAKPAPKPQPAPAPEKQDLSDLSTRAMLVTLHISQWSNQRKDHKATELVQKSMNVTAKGKKGGRYIKYLIDPDAPKLREAQRAFSAVYTHHIDSTLPWLDDGTRVLSAMGYDPYQKRQRELIDEAVKAVKELKGEFGGYVKDWEKQVNGLFDASDYDTPEEMAEQWSVDHKFRPLVTAGDFRVSLSAVEAARIREEINADAQLGVQAAFKDIAERVLAVAGRVVERMKAYKPHGEGCICNVGGAWSKKPKDYACPVAKTGQVEGKFTDTLIGNVETLAELLPSLNITADPRIAAVQRELEAMGKIDPEDLRYNGPEIRTKVADQAEAIMKKMEAFI